MCLGNFTFFFWQVGVEILGRKVKPDGEHKSVPPPGSSYHKSSHAASLTQSTFTQFGSSCINVFNLYKSSRNLIFFFLS